LYQTLTEYHPTVKCFHRAIGALLKKGHYPAGKDGRGTDGLVYIVKGKGRYDFGDYRFEVGAGDLLYLSKGSIYSIDITSQVYEVLIANFDFFCEDGVMLQSSVCRSHGAKSNELLFRKMLSAWQMRSPFVKEECLCSLYGIYTDFLRSSEQASFLPVIKRQRMENALSYINEHLCDRDLSVPDIAEHVHLSVSYFRSSFKEAFNISPVAYINMQRMKCIKEQLRYTSDPIHKIAESFGFSSVYHFCHSFKKEFGCTPGEYRAKFVQYPKT